MPRLVKACPPYAPLLDEYLREEAEEGRTERLIYVETSDFAWWLVKTVAAGDTKWIQPFADELEQLLVEGDEETRQVAVIGPIEDIQEDCVETNVDPDLFLNALGPSARTKWFETIRWKFAGRMDRWKGSVE